MEGIITKIRDEKDSFRNDSIELAPGHEFSQFKTLNRIDLYYNSQFESGKYDEDGWEKPFYNIVRKPCQIASKEIDLDTKDIIIRTDGNYVAAQIMSADLKQWMKEEGFAKKLNEYADLAPVYGSVVVKEVDKGVKTVNIRNLTLSNTAADTLDDTDIIETHLYNFDELRRVADKKDWDKEAVEEVIKAHVKLGKTLVEVDERYGWVTGDMLDGPKDEMEYTLAVVAGANLSEKDKNGQLKEKGKVFYHQPVKKHPYREWHFEKRPGRWLGVGFVELGFDAQVRRNETAYYKSKALKWTSQHIFETDDETAADNYANLLDLQNGTVLKMSKGSALTQVDMGERNLAHYGEEERVWESLVSELTFSTEVISGESLPSGTPARSAIITDQNVKRYFDRKREDFGIFVKDILETYVFPQFKTKKKKAHILSFSGSVQEMERLQQLLIDAKMTKLFNERLKEGKVPTLDEWTRIEATERQKLANSRTVDIEIPEGFYENIEHQLDVVITKENEDTASKIAGRQAVLQVLGANPAIVQNPATRGVFLELAHLLGVQNIPANLPPPQQGLPALTPGSPVPAPVTAETPIP